MGLKSFCPWCLKLGSNTETIAVHLTEIHYRMAIVANICRYFTGMNAYYILDHHTILGAKPSVTGKQGTCRTGGTGKGREIAQEVQVLGKKGDILTTQLRGHQRITRVECHSLPCLVQPENVSWHPP